MRTWDDWSDFEINRAVAEVAGNKVSDEQFEGFGSCVTVSNDLDYDELFDYCNDWSDIGPLIYENDICLEFGAPIVKACTAYKMEFVEPDTFGRSFYHLDKNPLRAAAIVFLMMNGVKP